MHPFFSVMEQTLRAAPLPLGVDGGVIVFHVLGLEEERWAVELAAPGLVVRAAAAGEGGDLTVFLDRQQLDSMLRTGFSGRALRVTGKRELLDVLAALLAPP